jgi:hypothetical protein
MYTLLILGLLLGVIFLPSVSSFETDVSTESNTIQTISPKDDPSVFIDVDLGTIIIEMKESGEGDECDEYPFSFDVDPSGVIEPTVDVSVKTKLSLFPMFVPEIKIVFIDNRPIHPAYKLVVVFCTSGGENAEIYVTLTIDVKENENGEEEILLKPTNSAFACFPWREGIRTFDPNVKIYRDYVDIPYFNNLRHTEPLCFHADVTIEGIRSLTRISSFPFFQLIKKFFIR